MQRGHTYTIDWYHLGALIYEMLVGVPPYFAKGKKQQMQNIQSGVLRIPKTMPEDAR